MKLDFLRNKAVVALVSIALTTGGGAALVENYLYEPAVNVEASVEEKSEITPADKKKASEKKEEDTTQSGNAMEPEDTETYEEEDDTGYDSGDWEDNWEDESYGYEAEESTGTVGYDTSEQTAAQEDESSETEDSTESTEDESSELWNDGIDENWFTNTYGEFDPETCDPQFFFKDCLGGWTQQDYLDHGYDPPSWMVDPPDFLSDYRSAWGFTS